MIRRPFFAIFSMTAMAVPRVLYAGDARLASGASRPEWVIWGGLLLMMLILLLVIVAQGKGLRKGGKGGHPYL